MKTSVTVKSEQSEQILMHPGTGRGPFFHVPKNITLLYVENYGSRIVPGKKNILSGGRLLIIWLDTLV